MRVDVHTHIFPLEMVQDRELFFAGEPAFKLLYESPKAKLITAEMLLEAMDQEGIDRSIVFGFPWQNAQWASRHNDYVLEVASKYTPKLVPLACFDPVGKEALKEAERCLRNGAKGLGELAIYGPCNQQTALQSLQGLIECCRSWKAILLVHANEPIGHFYPGKAPLGLDFYYELAKLAAGMPLILAHWGGGLCFYELLKKEVPEVLKHVYYDTAASPFLYRSDIYSQMVRALGKEKILFGSDYPLLPPKRYLQEIEASGVSEEEKNAILGDNAVHLFRL
jgi:predicted TIM-barrel fold metal-dependent hydrolase